VVVDASQGRLDEVRAAFPAVRWFDYQPPPGVNVSIAHQRNFGVRESRGDIVVFTDAGCSPEPRWLAALVRPLLEEHEDVSVGRAIGRGRVDLYDAIGDADIRYLAEFTTINVALRRSLLDAVGGFDEAFEYGSDIDLSWRLADTGVRIRNTPEALITVDWGTPRRQLRRAWAYGRARARLYRKHPRRLRTCWRTDPAPFAYAAFLIGLPLTAVFPLYPLVLIVPVLRNRRTGAIVTVLDHLVLGAGMLRELVDR
jgi:GT2 family glycosyltransferase